MSDDDGDFRCHCNCLSCAVMGEPGHDRCFCTDVEDGLDECEHDSHTGIEGDLWRCDGCGEVIRYVDDPNGNITIDTLHPRSSRRVRIEVVTPAPQSAVEPSQ